jgi:hypothetical protein
VTDGRLGQAGAVVADIREAPALSAIPPANEDRFEAAAAEMLGAMGLLSRACWPRSW